ncbi:MAG: glycosyltransferase, partial [Sphingomonadales bacterium]|nr:glycosyltransferase [Sphingomonadales bacterium]
LSAFDIFWQTSASEGLPNALIEAQFAGLPVIAFDVGGVGETFIDGETGVLVPSGDTGRLAAESLARLADREWIENARSKAPIQAAARFSADRFHSELTGLYGEAV